MTNQPVPTTDDESDPQKLVSVADYAVEMIKNIPPKFTKYPQPVTPDDSDPDNRLHPDSSPTNDPNHAVTLK